MRTFIVRLAEDAGGSDRGAATARLRGVVDEVATGLRTTFRNEQELVTALMAAISAAHEPPQDRPIQNPKEN